MLTVPRVPIGARVRLGVDHLSHGGARQGATFTYFGLLPQSPLLLNEAIVTELSPSPLVL